MKKLILMAVVFTAINAFGATQKEELAALATAAQSSELETKLEELRAKGFYLKGLELVGRARCEGVLIYIDVQVARSNEKAQSPDLCILKMQVGHCGASAESLKVGGILSAKCQGPDGHLYGITD